MAFRSILHTFIHLAGALIFGYALAYDILYVTVPSKLRSDPKFKSLLAFPGKWKFLTVWDLVLQLVYHSYALFNDIFGTTETQRKKQGCLQKIRDAVFAGWAFPTGTFVSLSFWGLYALDRKLVFPKEMDLFYPSWLNHAVHTGPIVFLLMELFAPKVFPKRALCVILNLAFSSAYVVCVIWVNRTSGVWAYPVLDMLNNQQRAMFIGGAAFCILMFYFVGAALNRCIWGDPDKQVGKSGVNSKKKKIK